MKPVAVFDLGGTKTLVAIVESNGKLSFRKVFATPRASCEEVLGLCRQTLEEGMAARGVTWRQLGGLGVSLPGTVDAEQGILLHAPFAGWHRVPVTKLLNQWLPDVTVCVENDVNACAVGEMRFGVGRKSRNMLWVTVSTGIGGAIVADGRLIHGYGQTAGEIGHLRVETEHPARCSCGKLGCLEAQASGTAMTRYVREFCTQYAEVAARMMAGGFAMDAKGACQLCETGDLTLLPLFERCGRYLGQALGVTATLLNPEWIVLGGGMAAALPFYRKAMEGSLSEQLMPDAPMPSICSSPLGYDAAAIGAAAMVMDRQEEDADAGADCG